MDLAGAFGDIGVLFPIAVALITLNHLNPTAVFLAAVVLLAAGIAFGVIAQWGEMPALVWAPLPIALLHPSWAELWQVLPLLVLPQLPLTFGNSIVATEDTARLLYGEQARRVTV